MPKKNIYIHLKSLIGNASYVTWTIWSIGQKIFGLENNPTMKHRTYSTVHEYPKGP